MSALLPEKENLPISELRWKIIKSWVELESKFALYGAQ